MTDERKGLCLCDVFHGEDTDCAARATQEDLLCDDCRVYMQSVKAQHAEVPHGPPTTSGVHASGETSRGGRHITWAAYAKRFWALNGPPGVGDEVRVDLRSGP